MLGGYADRPGRKAALFLSIMLIMIGTLLMAVMPAYATIGILAPIGVLLARLMQGFAGGRRVRQRHRLPGRARHDRRGFFASWQWSGQGLATALASAFGFVLTTTLTPDQLQSLGLAHSVPLWAPDRPDRPVYPQPSRRNAGIPHH